MSDDYTDLRPDDCRPVEILTDAGEWVTGELQAYRRDKDGTWRGWVRWSPAIGATHIGWFTEDRLRRGDQQLGGGSPSS